MYRSVGRFYTGRMLSQSERFWASIGGSLRQRDRVAVAPGLRSGDPEFKVLEGSGQLS